MWGHNLLFLSEVVIVDCDPVLPWLADKVDIFGFGIVALEIVSGRPNSDSSLERDKVYLLEWVKMHRFSYFVSLGSLFPLPKGKQVCSVSSKRRSPLTLA